MKESQVSNTTEDKRLYKRQFNVMKDKIDIHQNKIFHLEDSTVMYGIYNSDT